MMIREYEWREVIVRELKKEKEPVVKVCLKEVSEKVLAISEPRKRRIDINRECLSFFIKRSI